MYGPDILYIHEDMTLPKPLTPVTNQENTYFRGGGGGTDHKVTGEIVVLKLLNVIALERINLPCKPCGSHKQYGSCSSEVLCSNQSIDTLLWT